MTASKPKVAHEPAAEWAPLVDLRAPTTPEVLHAQLVAAREKDPAKFDSFFDHLFEDPIQRASTLQLIDDPLLRESVALASLQGRNNVLGVIDTEGIGPLVLPELAAPQAFELPHLLPAQLEVKAPGALTATVKRNLPKLDEWPTSPALLAAELQDQGYTAEASMHEGSTVFRKGKSEVTMTPLTLAGREGYVARTPKDQHVQLDSLNFTNRQWAAFTDGYESTLRTYNGILTRPILLNRSPSPRDGSQHHGPQDGIKHFIRLGKSLDVLTDKREKAIDLMNAREAVNTALAKAAKKGRSPKHVMIVVEGLDGASKTGNGLTLTRLLEEQGYTVKVRAFRGPSAEERVMAETNGPLARYEDFVDVKNADKPTVWLLDRGYPGDFVHNPTADLKALAKDADKFEKKLRKNGVLVVKMVFHPSATASMATFGKRLARAQVAEDLLLRRRDELSAEDVAWLRQAAKLTPGFGDFQSVTIANQVQGRYEAFAKKNDAEFPWAIIDTSNRHDGRMKSLEHFADAVAGNRPKERFTLETPVTLQMLLGHPMWPQEPAGTPRLDALDAAKKKQAKP